MALQLHQALEAQPQDPHHHQPELARILTVEIINQIILLEGLDIPPRQARLVNLQQPPQHLAVIHLRHLNNKSIIGKTR